MKTYIGIDPGGIKAFGWCVLEFDGSNLLVSRLVSGTSSNIAEAMIEIEQACRTVPLSAGIDAPLYWIRSGERMSDQKIRKAVSTAGGSSSTVGHVNSLRGACLVQGVLSVVALAEKWPSIVITEFHPKALLSVWPQAIDFTKKFHFNTEHERDAALGAYAAFVSVARLAGWVDWVSMEKISLFRLVGMFRIGSRSYRSA